MKNLRIIKDIFNWILVPAIAIGLILWPSLSSSLERLQTDPGDTLLNLYFLEHAYQHFTNSTVIDPVKFWSPDIFWPIQDTLAWSDHLLGPSVIFSGFRVMLDSFQSYLCWLATTLFLNYIAIRLACSRISPKTNEIWLTLTALATVFSPAIIQQLGHPQLLSLFLTGPILLLCHRLIQEPIQEYKLTDWLMLGSWLIANGFFNIYIFVYACYGALASSLIHLIRRIAKRDFSVNKGSNLPRKLGIFLGLCIINLIIYIPYFQTLEIFGKRPSDEILNNLPKVSSWLYGTDQWFLTPPLIAGRISSEWVKGAEQELFPGWLLCILLAATILTAVWIQNRKNKPLNRWLIVISMMILCSLNIGGFSLWPLVSKFLPGASSLRASSRVAMVIVIFTAPAISLASAQWQIIRRKSFTPAIELTVTFLAFIWGFLSIWPIKAASFSLKEWKDEQLAISDILKDSDCDLFWYEWRDQPPWRAHVLAMYTQLTTNIPTANGYSGHFPRENWPFNRAQGDKALHWRINSNPGRFHKLKPINSPLRSCIVTTDIKMKAKIRNYSSKKAVEEIGEWISYPETILFDKNMIKIASKDGQLYLNHPKIKKPDQWALITRNGNGINSDRGIFQIVDARQSFIDSTMVILITDQNASEGIEYIWRLNSRTGEFLSEIMKPIEKH